MARMTEAAKRKVPKSERGVPGKSGTGSYPLDTPKHRRAAVALAAMHHGSDSSFTKKIRAKAKRVAGRIHRGVTDLL
jgi:hypothetical protein